jgi:hypothetical protein
MLFSSVFRNDATLLIPPILNLHAHRTREIRGNGTLPTADDDGLDPREGCWVRFKGTGLGGWWTIRCYSEYRRCLKIHQHYTVLHHG